MLQKTYRPGVLMLFVSACCLCGCSNPDIVQAKTPSPTPAISQAATPTIDAGQSSSASDFADTPIPTADPTQTPSPTPIPSVPEAPTTVNTEYSTYTFLVNRDYPLSESYVPSDLVVPDIPFSFQDKTADKRKLCKVAADALEELCSACTTEAGLTIYGVSGYRSYNRQYDIYGSNIIKKGLRHTNLYSAAPGTSEHQTGLAIDVSCESIGYALDNRFAETSEGIWLKENCWRFGFILRYPKEKESITGYAYEPWHIRYVGVPLAYYLYTNNLTLEEYYGSPSSQTLEELADQPLIDMTTKRFYQLYASTLGSELYYDSKGNVLISPKTNYPYLKEKIVDANGKAITVDGKFLYMEPARDKNGNLVTDKNGNLVYTKPYFDASGNLWLDHNGSPVYLQPLWNANGTLAYDNKGNVLYTEPVYNSKGTEFITTTGAPLLKVPVRNAQGELTYSNGSVIFYEPLTDPITKEILLGSDGLPVFSSTYYEVPHNTYPYPNGFTPSNGSQTSQETSGTSDTTTNQENSSYNQENNVSNQENPSSNEGNSSLHPEEPSSDGGNSSLHPEESSSDGGNSSLHPEEPSSDEGNTSSEQETASSNEEDDFFSGLPNYGEDSFWNTGESEENNTSY